MATGSARATVWLRVLSRLSVLCFIYAIWRVYCCNIKSRPVNKLGPQQNNGGREVKNQVVTSLWVRNVQFLSHRPNLSVHTAAVFTTGVQLIRQLLELSHPRQTSLPRLIGPQVSYENECAPAMTSKLTRAQIFSTGSTQVEVSSRDTLKETADPLTTPGLRWTTFGPVVIEAMTSTACVQLSRF